MEEPGEGSQGDGFDQGWWVFWGGEAGTSFSIKISYFLTQKDGNMKFRWVCMVIDYSMDEKTKFIPNSS